MPPVSVRRDPGLLVVALGGKALGVGASAGPEAWLRGLARSLPPLADLVVAGYRLILTHGGELARDEVPRGTGRRALPPAPLDVLRAESQGAGGYLIQQVLGNLCRNRSVDVPIAVVVTRVRVDPDDPAFGRPDRPVGPVYGPAAARRLERERGWTLAGSAARGRWRVVPSPRPREILDADAVRRLAAAGVVPIAAGGGGVPVVETALGYRGVDAILQEDATAALLATAVAADRLILATGVDRVEVGHRTTRAIGIEHLSVSEARALRKARAFPAATMGAKIDAAVDFVETAGGEAIITSLPSIRAALDGRAGTHVVPG